MTRKVLYAGESMRPHFLVGDTLLVVPYGLQEISPGDVVVFPHPQTKKQVVHRVVAVTLEGVCTKGDNNSKVDEWILKPQDILGRVVAIQREGRTLQVPDRVTVTFRLFQARNWLDRAASRLLHPIYHRLAQSGIFRNCLPASIKPRLLCFPRPEGTEWQLWMGWLLVGRKLPTWPQWSIRRPFRLFVDVASLPERNTDFQSPPSS